jgi:SAM-dependent methyltransferase
MESNKCDHDEYAMPPFQTPNIVDCSFYHTIELPGFGLQQGHWDLRPNIRDYLGPLDFKELRVLEIGPASGFVSFELERRGASVVGFDLPDPMTFDLPPGSKSNLWTEDNNWVRRMHNAYWLAHKLLGSNAKMAYGHANRLPKFLGNFDAGVIANVLQHLRDPVGALIQLAHICESIVVTEADWMAGENDDLNGMMMFDPKVAPFSWYQLKPKLIETVLSRMGFGEIHVTRHAQLLVQEKGVTETGPMMHKYEINVPHFTITARRKPYV